MAVTNLKLKKPNKTTEEYRAAAEGKAPPDTKAPKNAAVEAKQEQAGIPARKVTKTPPKPAMDDDEVITYHLRLEIPAKGEFPKFDKICESFSPKEAFLRCLRKAWEEFDNQLIQDGRALPDYRYKGSGKVVKTTRAVPAHVHKMVCDRFDEHGLMNISELSRIFGSIVFVQFMTK